MNFNEFIETTKKPDADFKKIADEFKTNFSTMQTSEDVIVMAQTIVMVCGEKLGKWEQGLELLKKLKNNATILNKEEMNRCVAILTLGNDPHSSIEKFSAADQKIIYTATAKALTSLGGLKNAEKLLEKASKL
jgi:2-methylaconitate cis-trans-isomerase PrpF